MVFGLVKMVRRLRVFEGMGTVWLVGGGGFAADFEALCEQDQGGSNEGDDADDVEAVHEGHELGLRVELLVDAGVGGGDGICG